MAALVALIVAAPVVWLMLLQTNYILSYAACADRTNAWLHKPNAVAMLAGGVLIAASWFMWARSRGEGPPRGFLALVGLGLSVLFFLILLASAVPPLIHQPCD